MPTDLPDFTAATLATDRPSDYDKVARKTRRKVILWVVVSLLVVGGCLGAVEWHYLTTRWVGDAKVGECLTSTGVNEENANGVKVVDCDNAEAFYRDSGQDRDRPTARRDIRPDAHQRIMRKQYARKRST